MEITYIYTLSDPITGDIRYVGKTNNLKQRYKAHCNPSREQYSHKYNWIQSLRKQRLKPIMEVIDEVPISEWKFWEQWWFQVIKSWDYDLVNHTAGGDGLTFGNDTTFKPGHGALKVYAYSADYTCIEFNSQQEAQAQLNISDSCLRDSIKKSRKNKTGLFLTDSPKTNEEINAFFATETKRSPNKTSFVKGQIPWNMGKHYHVNNGKHVYQYSKDKQKLIAEFDSLRLAAEATNISDKNISRCVNNKSKSAGGYFWTYEKL